MKNNILSKAKPTIYDENTNGQNDEKTNKNAHKVCEDYECSVNDSNEVKELKNRMKIIMNKFNTCKKEKEILNKDNKSLQEEIMQLQSNLRQMISGFANTSSSFPMLNELTVQIAEFYKYDCLDLFFDLLCPELNMKGILFFYSTSFTRLNEQILQYLLPAVSTIKKVGCFENIDGPIMNVLRKSYQINYKEMIKKCFVREQINLIADEIQNNLKLGGLSQQTQQQIYTFLNKLGELLFYYQISDPPLVFDPKSIGVKVIYNALKHDPFDGFIKPKEECIVILPSVHKLSLEGELMAKALVLQINYEIPNQ